MKRFSTPANCSSLRRTLRNLSASALAGLFACGAAGFHAGPWNGPAVQAADIGSAAPAGVLPVRPENAGIAEEAAQVYAKFADGVADWKDKSLDQLKKIDPTGLGKVHVLGEQLGRLAERLAFLGEPAGEELRLRKKVLREAIQSPMNSVGLVRASDFQRQLPALIARAKQRTAKIPAIDALVKKGKWIEAERELQLILDELEGPAAFYDGKNRGEILAPFAEISKTVLDGRRTFDRETFRKGFTAAQTAYDAAHAQFSKEAAAAAEAVRTQRKASIGGTALEGPETASALLLQFRAVGGLGLQARGWAWCDVEQYNPDRVAVIETQHEERFAALLEALPALIDADAAAAPPDDARALYGRYVVALAPLAAEAADPQVRVTLKSALGRLAAKHPTLPADVQAYAEATGEILRWRKRSVEAAAAARRTGSAPFLPLVIEAGSGGGTGQGLFSSAAKTTADCSFAYPLDLVAERMKTQLSGKATAAPDVRRDPASSDSRGVSAYSPRLRATAILDPTVWAPNARQLLLELQITDKLPPLTLEAAAAQYQVERGLFTEVGGTIAGFRFQPLAGLFSGWSPEADYLPYGPLPAEKGADPFRGVVVSVHLEPKWLRGEYIFAFPQR